MVPEWDGTAASRERVCPCSPLRKTAPNRAQLEAYRFACCAKVDCCPLDSYLKFVFLKKAIIHIFTFPIIKRVEQKSVAVRTVAHSSRIVNRFLNSKIWLEEKRRYRKPRKVIVFGFSTKFRRIKIIPAGHSIQPFSLPSRWSLQSSFVPVRF